MYEEYKELVRLLKDKAERFNYDGWVDTAVVMEKAADAIEKLSKQVELEYQSGFADGQIAANRKKLRWIPVTERLPKSIHEYVLCCGEKGGQFVSWVTTNMILNVKARAFQHGGKGRYITHWMPLPKPPKEE